MKRKFFTLLSFITLLTPLFLKSQTVYPYLQSATSSSIYITWKTSSEMQSLVEYGSNPGALTTIMNGSTQILSDTGFPNNYFYHTVKLTNLNPNTLYYYKVSSGSFNSAVHSFKTLPLPGNAATADGHIRFLIMGDNEVDNHPRYDSLMVKAKRNCEQKYAGTIQENISGILMLGDQVKESSLANYEKVHFSKSKYLSPYLPIQTAVGENETNGSLKLAAYNQLFYYDSLSYKGIYSGTENYYAYQVGNVLILNLSTEHPGSNQFSWLQKVVKEANEDITVQWIISLGHKPYQAEQYVGDISSWVRNTVVPYLASSPKFLMQVGGHHHLYARGQLKNNAVYNVISGGASFDQFWQMSQEQDMEEVQKTIPNWCYTIVDVDVTNGKVDVETYSIGSTFGYKNNQLIDQFHRYKNQLAPLTPSFTNTFGDSLQLPYTISGSAFNSPTGELLNSTEFQISLSKNFTTLEKDFYRDYENLFGYEVKADSSKDLNAGQDILNVELNQWSIPNGKHYIRVRYRDRNLEWSPWSEIDSFRVYNSVSGIMMLETDKKAVELTDSIKITYTNGPGQAKDWIGIFKEGTIPAAGTVIQRSYTSGSNGALYFKNMPSGQYYVAFFSNDTYIELTNRVSVYFGNIPVVTTNKTNYLMGDSITVSYAHAPAFAQDWVGIYRVGDNLNGIDPKNWNYVSGSSGSIKFGNLTKGYYFASYFVKDTYTEPGERSYFVVEEQMADTITSLVLDKSVYKLGESISVSWTDAPGTTNDKLIIYPAGSTPGTSTPVSILTTESKGTGSLFISGANLPKTPGNYFISVYTNNVFTEISNRVNFAIVDSVVTSIKQSQANSNNIKIYPNPITKNGSAIIESNEGIQRFEFIDIMGRVLYAVEQVNTNSYSLLNLNLPAGIYYIRVYQNNHTIQLGKIIVHE